MKNIANKKTERKYKLNKTLLVNEKVINIKHQIIWLLSFSITIQYGDWLGCYLGNRFFSDDLFQKRTNQRSAAESKRGLIPFAK